MNSFTGMAPLASTDTLGHASISSTSSTSRPVSSRSSSSTVALNPDFLPKEMIQETCQCNQIQYTVVPPKESSV